LRNIKRVIVTYYFTNVKYSEQSSVLVWQPILNTTRYFCIEFSLLFYSTLQSVNAVRAIGNENVPKIIINDTIQFIFLNCNQHFANFEPQQFPSAV